MSEGYNTVEHKTFGPWPNVACGSRRAIIAHRTWDEVTCKRCLAKKPVEKKS